MNYNTRKTLTALECLGLNLGTGCSPFIDVNCLEKISGVRQVSNGSKIIRRDSDVFSKFVYSVISGENGEIVGYEFAGYKTSNGVVSEVSADILRLKEKINNLHSIIEDKETYVSELLASGYFQYDEFDLI